VPIEERTEEQKRNAERIKKMEPRSKYVEERGDELYINGKRLSVYSYRLIYQFFEKHPKELTDKEVEKYEKWVGIHGGIIGPADLLKWRKDMEKELKQGR